MQTINLEASIILFYSQLHNTNSYLTSKQLQKLLNIVTAVKPVKNERNKQINSDTFVLMTMSQNVSKIFKSQLVTRSLLPFIQEPTKEYA